MVEPLPLFPLFALSCLLFQLSWAASGSGPVEVRSFAIPNGQSLTTPQNLGAFPHDCVGNIQVCDNGFTVGFWYKALAGDPDLPERYIISSGGQSAMSEGFYVLQHYGKDYEVGVAKGNKLWTVSLFVHEDALVYFVLTWSEQGLDVYIDGILAGADAKGKARVFTSPAYDPFPEIVVGYANDRPYTGKTIKEHIVNVTHWSAYYHQEEVEHLQGEAPKDLYHKGCVSTLPQGVDDGVNVKDVDTKGVYDRVAKCRRKCAEKGAYVAFMKGGEMCYCYIDGFTMDFLDGLSTSATCSDYDVFWVKSHETEPDYPIELEVEVIPSTPKPYIRPEETVTFKSTFTTDEYVTFTYDFGDGTDKTSKNPVISHSWEKEGSFLVKITATTRLMSETVLKTINITYVEEGVAPEQVLVKMSPKDSSLVEFDLTTIGKYETECTIEFGDGESEDVSVKDYIEQLSLSHDYKTPGFYDVVYSCENEYGVTADQGHAFAVKHEIEYQNEPRFTDIRLEVVGADSHQDVFGLKLNGLQVAANTTSGNVIIQANKFLYSGEHIVEVTAQDDEVRRRIFNIEEKIEKVAILTNNSQVLPGEEVTFTFQIYKGDHIHVLIEYGDGASERVYIPQGGQPAAITRVHKYESLNHYKVKVTAVNYISKVIKEHDISIERPLMSANMHAQNVTVLLTETIITIKVDENSPATPVDVMFDYGDGKRETVRLGSHRSKAEPMVHSHIYSEYGIYVIHAIIRNNISEIEVEALHQVGENITMLDLYANRYRLLDGEEINITMDAPYGYPLVYNLDMGDGTTLTVRRPLGYTGAFESDPIASTTGKTYYPPDFAVTEVTKTENTTSVILDRQRRDVNIMPTTVIVPGEGEVLAVMSTPAPMAADSDMSQNRGQRNEKVTVTYRYSRSGTFNVMATVDNPFGGESTYLCPDIVVLPANQKQPDCSGLTVSFHNATSKSSPLVIQRSKSLTIPTDVQLNCQKDASQYQVDYTWKAARHVMGDLWRPELEVCHSQVPEANLVIPTNTLWYGLYRIKVITGIRLPHPTRNRRSTNTTKGATNSILNSDPSLITAEKDVYLKVEKTPLVAQLRNSSKKLDVFANTAVTISGTGSFDPDVVGKHSNKTGMTGAIICYPHSRDAEMKKLSSKELLALTTLIQNNSRNTVSLYDTDCFVNATNVQMLDWDVTFFGDLLVKDKDLTFRLFVWKDDREATTSQIVKVLQDLDGDNLFANLDNLLNSGDTSAALYVLGHFTAGLNGGGEEDGEKNNTDVKNERSELRGKLIGVLGRVADQVGNFDQLTKTTDVLSGVTEVRDEVTEDSRASAADAMSSGAAKTVNLTNDAPLDQVAGLAGGMVGVAGNVLPFADEEEETVIEAIPAASGVTTIKYTTVETKTLATTIKPPSNFEPTTQTSVTTAYVPTTAAPTVAASDNDTILVNGTWVTATPVTTVVSTMVVPSVTTVTIKSPKQTVTNTKVTSYKTQQVTTTTVAYTTTAPPTEATTQNIIANLKTTMPPGLAAVVEEDVPPCCSTKGGLCAWIEPPCEFLSEDDRKKQVWDDNMCNALHPDDLKEIAWRYGLFKAQQKRMLFARRKRTTQGAMGAVDNVGTAVLGKADKDTNVSISTPKMKLELAKVEPGQNGTMNGIAFPGSALGDTEGAGASSMESDNAFTYSDSAKSVKGKVKSLAFKDKDGNEIKMNGTAEPFVIWMDGPGDSFPDPKQATFATSTQVLKFNYHTINTTYNDSSIHFMIRPRSPHDVYEVYIKWENFTLMNSSKENGNVGFPNETWYDHKGIVPNDESPQGDDPIVNELLRYTYFPPPEVTRLNGTYRVGVRLLETKLSFANGPSQNNYTYFYNSFVSGCRYWDDEADAWSAAGCTVGNLTSIYSTQCLCNHLTSFGSDMVVPPNTIDFSTVFSLENFIEAIPVFVTVGLVLLLYLGVIIWARRADKKDVIKWGAQPLEDNLPSDQYHYQITVYTGGNKNAETTSRVSLIISGDDGDTGVRRLWDGKRKELEKASINNYILSTEGCLGPLSFLRIWHDNTGSGKKRSWFLDQVQVKDLQTGELFCFLCDRWLAVEQDDGLVERIIPVAGLREMTAFKHLFNSSVKKKLANDHLWVSVVKRPTRSNFTRVQRVSACAALLFLTMITNCMFFKADENKENVRAISFGPFEFTLHQLFISVVTTCIVFPPSLLIITIFRRVKPKSNGVMQSNQRFSQKSSKFKWRRYNPGSSLWDNQPSRAQRMKESLRNILSQHQKTKYQDDNLDELGLPKKKKPWMLPHWCIYIAWTLCITAILASAFFTVLYSMQWGRKKSLDWLSTFVLSFFQSVIVVQPVKVLLLAAFLSCVMRKPDLDNEDEVFDECHNALPGPDESMDKANARNIDDILIQRKSAVTHMQPPDMASLEEARQLRMKEMAMEAILKECIVYFFFILVVFFLSYQARDSDSYQFANNIKNQFVRGSTPLDSISKPDSVWTYLRNTVLPNMYSNNWYNGRELTDWRELLQIDDRCTIRVGVARLRLQRIKEDSCEVQKVFRPIFDHCRNNYNWMDDDTKDYLPGWVVPTAENRHRQGVIDCYSEALEFENETSLRDEESPWIYRNSIELKSAPYAGTHAMYKGGGYTFTFKRTPEATKRLLDEMEQYEWVNPNARAMFIEFTLYNGNVNLFGSVILLVEWIAGGGATVRHEVKVFRLNNYVGSFGVIVILFEVLFLAFTVYFLVKEITKLKKERMKYFKEFWNMLELSTLILSLVVIAMYALKAIFGKVALHVLEQSESGEYVNFVTIGVWDEMFTFLLAFVVYLTTVKFIKMLRFNRRMGMLGDTIRIATKDLKNFIIMFFIYFFAFCMFAYVIFGTQMGTYGNFIKTMESLFSFALGSFDFDAMRQASNIGVLFFILYVFVVFIGLMGMFLTIIADAFTAVKEDTALRSNDYEIVDFILGKFKGVFGW